MNILRKFIDKCLSVSRLGERWSDCLIQGIVEAGRTISYVETTTPSKADSLHLAIKGCDNRTFMHEFERNVRFAIAKLKFKRVKIGFDTTEDLTWIKQGFNLRPSVYDHPLLSWQFLNVSIVEPFYLPLMSIPYRQIDDLDKLVIDLLCYIRTLPIIVDLILFDRGFYHSHLIDYLNNAKGGKPWPYLILVPKRATQKYYIGQTRDKKLLFAYFNHIFNYKKDNSSWHPSTKIMVRIVDDKTSWCYATNQKPSLSLCMEYSKRWTLETGFRVHDEARIKSKSKNLTIRFFYHLISMLLIILWKLQNNVKIIVFKRYLKWLEYQFFPIEIKKVIYLPSPI
jgi:hypothetical protein